MKALIVPKNIYNGLDLKQPIEIDIEDETFNLVELAQRENKNRYVHLLSQLVKKHIGAYGYVMGKCVKREKDMTYSECLNCGILTCGGSRAAWETCRMKNISYAYPTKTMPKTIKDPKIIEKLKPTKEELEQERNLHIIDR